ncbi:hypothetical protein COA17_11045 [Sphingomonas ginsenosidimutans]|uniref:Peptidase C51 domain-containing protein n=1 Tax=Sphingomonas ginsenosidimutans TaxID=862134 RepID=A0A2A4HYC4_9SPHN|nr:TIGR02594 family protein [Sphingomonas ginsenosidimutans]PCG08685.1 hypothetical protein COA17_11045 [Sphingomonas ginsenosidimutans]
MANIDVVARLQLRAEQFSSEGGKKAAELASKMRTASQDVRASWASSFSDVQRLAATAFQMPRTAGGALDLSSEIGQLRRAAEASEQRAEAARQMAVAMQAAAGAANVDSEALRRDADAAAVSALASERDAAAIRERIIALEAVQVELNQTTMQTRQLTDTGNKHVVSANQQRQSMMMLGQQAQDFTVQVASGQSAVTAFVQQIGQASFALQGMGGRMAGVAAFLTSFGGILTTTAVIALAPFVAKILEGNDALGEAIDKLRKDAEETEVNRQAKIQFTRSIEGQIEAQRALNAEMERGLVSQRQINRQNLDNSQRRFDDRRGDVANLSLQLLQARQKLADVVAAAEQSSKVPTVDGDYLFAGQIQAASAEVDRLREELTKQRRAMREAEQGVIDATVTIAKENAAALADPVEQIKRKYDDLADAAIKAARNNKQLADSLEGVLAGYERQKDKETKAARDRESAAERGGRVALGTTIANEGGAATLAAAQRFVGAREDTAGGRATLRDLFGGAGISIDPEKTAWCAAFVNAVLAGQGIKGTGSLAARSFLNYGTATNRPTQGDIVVLRRGTGGQGHTGFYAGTDARGRVLVTGGNQDNGVSTAPFARSEVLGFRRAPTASRAYADELRAQKAAADEAKRSNAELERSLDQLADRFDPATAAARQYRDEIAAIIKLQAAGKLGAGEGFDLMKGARQRMVDARSNAFNQSFRTVIGEDSINAAVGELNAGIMSATDLWNHRLELGALNAGEALAGAVGNIADMFGLRIGGAANALFAPGGIQGGARETAKLLGESLKGVGLNLSDKSLGAITTALAGAATGQIGGSIFSGITGKKNSAVGSAAGGILGELAGKELGKVVTKEVGGALGKTLGGAAGPIGSLVGGALGGLLGGLFQKAKTGAVSVTGSNVGVIGGNNAGVQQVLSGLGGAVQKGVNRIVDQLGGTLGDYMVSIGKYDDYYRVSSTNTKTVGEKGYSPGRVPGLIYDGTDESAAVEAAIRDAIADGAVKGISEAAKRVLAAGKDLDSALNKALLIESVPRDLKAMLDPVGAAVDDLNRRFQKTVDALKEGGASAEEMARAEQLYNLQLQQVKNSTAAASASLKSFLTDLKLGGNSPYSLREQEATALAQLKPYLDQIGAGQRVDQDKYQQAARAYLDVERQLYGSTQAYFDAQAQIQAATAKAIETIDNAVPITPGVESPFAKATADSAAKTASNTQTGNELLSQLSDQMESVRQLLAQMQGGGASGFIGDVRAFG